MNITASALRELHRIHRQLADLRDRLQKGPKQIKAGEANVAELEQQLAEERQALKRTRITADEKQLQLKQREDRIQDLQGKLNACGSNREYQALREQIAADEQANSVLSDEILEYLELIDKQHAEVAQHEAHLAHARDELDKTRSRVKQEHEVLESELGRVTAELERAEAHLPGEFKTEYNRITRARGEDALAQVEGECCGGCFQMLTPQTMNDLYLGRPVFCKSCGCLLYLPEDRAPKPK